MNLRLLQIADSALPISGYTHSWGLEAAIAQKRVHDAESLEKWTRHWLKNSLGPMEGVLVSSSCRFAHENLYNNLYDLNRLAAASIVPPSTRRASREMGDQLMTLASTWSWSFRALERFQSPFSNEETGWHHPVVFGLLGAIAGGTPEDVLRTYTHQAALGMISAGVRAIPVGHTHGQQILAYLHDDITALVALYNTSDPALAGAGSPFYEVICDEQTQLYARMFRS